MLPHCFVLGGAKADLRRCQLPSCAEAFQCLGLPVATGHPHEEEAVEDERARECAWAAAGRGRGRLLRHKKHTDIS